jgi:hypothetical protein
MMAPGSTTSRRAPAAHSTSTAPSFEPPKETADMSWLVGLAVVGLVAIASTGVLTTLWHPPDGFAIVQFLVKPEPIVNTIAQGALGLVTLVVAGRSAKRGVLHWRGDLAGGRPGAIINAVFAGAFFFGAIELFRAAF